MIDITKPDAAGAAFSKLSLMALARADLFRLLVVAFNNPTPEFIQQLVSGSYLSELHGYFSDLVVQPKDGSKVLEPLKTYQAGLSGIDLDELLTEMRVEYARLFIGPGKPVVQPFETFYNEKLTSESQPLLIVSPAALAVETIYREAGLVMSTNEPQDHFAVELEFLYYSSRKESDAWAEGDNTAANRWHREQFAFIDGHLGVWGPVFCKKVQQESSHPFYRSIAHFTETFLKVVGSQPPTSRQGN